MDKKKIGILLIVLGIIIIFGSTMLFIIKNDNESGNNNIEKPENNEQNNEDNEYNEDNEDDEDDEESIVCLTDYQNASLKTVTAELNNNTIKIDTLACMTEKEIKDNKVKFFSKEDNSFYLEIIIDDENKQTYIDSLKSKYEQSQQTENYNLAITDEYTTNSGRKYNIINAYKTNENKEINYKDYNMIGNIDNSKIIHIRLVTNKYNLEAGFINVVEESLEIK